MTPAETVSSTLDTTRLPDNAYKPLAKGEDYAPVVPAGTALPEGTARAVLWGLFLCVIFTVASAYSGLKVGQVMEAAIPISILAIGLARVYRRRSTLLENVILTGIGGTSGAVVAGAIFTLPALYILKLDPHPVQTIFICLAGGCLGVLFLIPLRRYFVREMHGQLPYPEATAITEVLVTGEKGGSQAKLLLQATAIAGVYDFFVTTFQVWKEFVDLQFLPPVREPGAAGEDRVQLRRAVFILGLGYVMGLRSSMILVAGGVLSNFVLVPLIWMIGSHLPDIAVYPAPTPHRRDDGHADLPRLRALHRRRRHRHRRHLRHHQVAARRRRVVLDRVQGVPVRQGRRVVRAHRPRHPDHHASCSASRSARSSSASSSAAWRARSSIIAVGLALTLVFSFFFTSVAANAIATTARNPVSGMTMLTIIISSVVLLRFGLSGQTGHVLRHGDRRHGLHRAVGVGPDDHRPEDRLLARLDARRAGDA